MATIRPAPDRPAPRFHFIGGKGGVGKTTCAAAVGLAAARAGARVLVASTDPAPSLADAFDLPLSGAPRRITAAKGPLFAVEIKGPASFRRWLDSRREFLESIALQGTWLDEDDVQQLLGLSLPGIDEVAALFEIDRLARTNRFDEIVVDTAPTGHTLRMLDMPAVLAGVAYVFELMRQKGRAVEEALRGGWTPRAEDDLIDELAATAGRLSSLLRDASQSRVSWVTLAEPMASAETSRALDALRSSGIHVARLIVNRLTPAAATPCRHCDARRTFERRALRALHPQAETAFVLERHPEPRGVKTLSTLARELSGSGGAPRATTTRTWSVTLAGEPAAGEILGAETRLAMIGGKGGVGKTTCAAAIAVAAARRWPGRRTLLLSTDPAHSLADVLGIAVGDEPRPVPGTPGLSVRELDATGALAQLQASYTRAIEGMFDRARGAGSMDASYDRSVMRSLIALAPPGLDELAAIIRITEDLVSTPAAWDLVIMDTAPTGHALRLLETPALIQDWVRALMSMLLKYQSVVPLGSAGATLLNLSKSIGRLRTLMDDPARTVFVAVTRAAALPRLETVRLVRSLTAMDIAVPVVIVNAFGRGSCARCRRLESAQKIELRALARTLPRRPAVRLLVTPAQIPSPSGPSGLRRWSAAWRHGAE